MFRASATQLLTITFTFGACTGSPTGGARDEVRDAEASTDGAEADTADDTSDASGPLTPPDAEGDTRPARPTGAVGVPCTSDAACTAELAQGLFLGGAAGQGSCDPGLVCIPDHCGVLHTGFAGGICTRPCTSADECPLGSRCARTVLQDASGQVGRCLLECSLTDGPPCREGYECVESLCNPIRVDLGDVGACANAVFDACLVSPEAPPPLAFADETPLTAPEAWASLASAVADGAGGIYAVTTEGCIVHHGPGQAPAPPTCPTAPPEGSTETLGLCGALAVDTSTTPTTLWWVWTAGPLRLHGVTWVWDDATTQAAQLDPQDGSLGPPVPISRAGELPSCPVAVAGGGRVAIAYAPRDEPSGLVLALYAPAAPAPAPVYVTLPDVYLRSVSPHLAMDAAGDVHFAWQQDEGGVYASLRHLRVRAGTYAPDLSVVANTDRADLAVVGPWDLATSPDGRHVAIAWARAAHAVRLSPDLVGLSDATNVMIARSHDGGASFGPPERVHDDPDCATHFKPSVALDDAGRAHILWEDGRWADVSPLFVATAAGPGAPWSPPERVTDGDFHCNDDMVFEHRGARALVATGEHLFAVWSDDRDALQRVRAARKPLVSAAPGP